MLGFYEVFFKVISSLTTYQEDKYLVTVMMLVCLSKFTMEYEAIHNP